MILYLDKINIFVLFLFFKLKTKPNIFQLVCLTSSMLYPHFKPILLFNFLYNFLGAKNYLNNI